MRTSGFQNHFFGFFRYRTPRHHKALRNSISNFVSFHRMFDIISLRLSVENLSILKSDLQIKIKEQLSSLLVQGSKLMPSAACRFKLGILKKIRPEFIPVVKMVTNNVSVLFYDNISALRYDVPIPFFAWYHSKGDRIQKVLNLVFEVHWREAVLIQSRTCGQELR